MKYVVLFALAEIAFVFEAVCFESVAAVWLMCASGMIAAWFLIFRTEVNANGVLPWEPSAPRKSSIENRKSL